MLSGSPIPPDTLVKLLPHEAQGSDAFLLWALPAPHAPSADQRGPECWESEALTRENHFKKPLAGGCSPKNVPEARNAAHGDAWLEERGILVDSERREKRD